MAINMSEAGTNRFKAIPDQIYNIETFENWERLVLLAAPMDTDLTSYTKH